MVQLLLSIIYLAFISLGLPDGLLGAAWPSMYPQLQVPVSYAGLVSMIICLAACGSGNKNDIPVCLDPVGIGASSFRLKYANYLLKKKL